MFDAEQLPSVSSFISRDELYSAITTGGYPTVLALSSKSREEWLRGYIETIILKDIQTLDKIEEINEVPSLLRVTSRYAGQLFNLHAIASNLQISSATMKKYMSLLYAQFILDYCRAWMFDLNKRLIKTPKDIYGSFNSSPNNYDRDYASSA